MQPTENMDTLFVTVKDTRKGKKRKRKEQGRKGRGNRWEMVTCAIEIFCLAYDYDTYVFIEKKKEKRALILKIMCKK